MLMGFLEIACQKNIQRLITERDRCVDAHQIFQMVTTVARLLLQLAVRAVNLRLIRRIQLTSRNLQCIAVQRIAVLTHHENLSILRNRKHRCRAVMMDKIPFCLMSVYLDGIFVHFQDGSLIF